MKLLTVKSATTLLLMLAFAPTAFAQDAMPLVKEAPATADKPQFEMMGGDSDFFLATDPADGSIDYILDPETNELQHMIARKSVVLSNMDMALNCDQLDYDNAKTEMVATGRRVLVRQGDIIASCQLMVYNTTTQDSVLKGKPTIYMKSGKTVTTQTGEEIIIRRINGKQQITVKGNGQAFRNALTPKGATVTDIQKNPTTSRPAPDAPKAASSASQPVARPSKDGNAAGVGTALGIATDPQGIR